jgi:RNA recognition motif-containing protein
MAGNVRLRAPSSRVTIGDAAVEGGTLDGGTVINLYVGNLPFSTTSDELAALFGKVGAVTSAQVITDRETGRSRGFGFVEMNDEDARKAIDQLTGADFNGRSITVNEARPRAPRGGGGGGGNRDRRY